MYSHHEAKLGWGSSLGDKAYKALKNIVVNCHAPPGTRLDATAISTVLNMSATPVRDALIQLEIEEYIARFPGSGYYTRKLDPKRLSDEFGVTRTILQDAIRGKLDELHRRLPILQTTPRWNDYELAREFLEVFYKQITEALNNERMLYYVHESNIRTRYVRWLDVQRPGRLSCIRDDMSELLELLDKRDKNGAIANVDRQFSAIINTVPDLVLQGNDRAGNMKESWLGTLSSFAVES
ncbi:GntR family transcriptional regulator (plasmid) [Sinorhizobium medicae]|uniref:GntR family transcriptional regulator n=1 Tax=Sinorhizobium medicae TaxID=110321 RepID=UPI000FD8511A|nr:GntR family transcriptional regulator [Sinorhizobium medicae]MBO1965408.1 GntR family transcriptional regulator [Sinorhizobium medicae]RVJ75640.1 GntR family transcriptional regulator [Sinorhizobium medicae]WQO48953.1 GntR family transcriptional regulator [Sinorhizobium medicae]WQO56999.1 GntR family transcriptional regulator [Sinorhizobium medicae]WQO70556.1 GntR family transcriptional regulator [Sinorhizobium medicae]